MHKSLSASIAFALAAPFCASADSPPTAPSEIKQLRQEIEALRVAYEARLQAMEQRLLLAERVAAPPGVTPQVAAVPAPLAAAPAATSAEGGGANAFNPAMSLILSGGYTRTSQDPASFHLSGFQLPAGSAAGPGARGMGLAESELGLAANIDPWLRGAANISLHPDNTVSVEEAYVQTTALSNGLSVKAGRFFSGVGYLNSQHAHTWDFVDNPLAYQAFLGTQYGDDGVQLHWLAPTDEYLEIGAELGRGRSYPGSDTGRNGAGMSALTLHTGGDIGESHNWRAGISLLTAQANDQSLTTMDGSAGTVINSAFTGNTRVWVLDGVWKWAPNGNATQTNFKLLGEYLQSTRSGGLTYDPANANLSGKYRTEQSGWYVQGIYQFMPRWRAGLRTERLNPGSTDYAINTASSSGSRYQPSKNSLMLDFNPSEFSRVRLQLAQDKSREGLTDNQVLLQYQMSLGAHGAHSY
jgi:hypothetical protein